MKHLSEIIARNCHRIRNLLHTSTSEFFMTFSMLVYHIFLGFFTSQKSRFFNFYWKNFSEKSFPENFSVQNILRSLNYLWKTLWSFPLPPAIFRMPRCLLRTKLGKVWKSLSSEIFNRTDQLIFVFEFFYEFTADKQLCYLYS